MTVPGQSEPSATQTLRDVRSLRRALAPDLSTYRWDGCRGPYLVMLSGLPGTGKSHFARCLALRRPFLVIGSDRTRKTLVARPEYTRDEHVRVFAACHGLIEELLLSGYRVIFDATNLTDGFRNTVYDIAGRTGTPFSIVAFSAPDRLVRRRLRDRSAGVDPAGYSDADWEIYCRLRPGQESISRPHLTVDSSRDITPMLDRIDRMVRAACPP